MSTRSLPVLWSHLGAYARLAVLELAQYRARWRLRIVALALVATGLAGALAMGCVAVIAANWDTAHRMAAIYALLGGFLALALVAAAVSRRQWQSQPPPFPRLRSELSIDREILARLLCGTGSQESVRVASNDEQLAD